LQGKGEGDQGRTVGERLRGIPSRSGWVQKDCARTGPQVAFFGGGCKKVTCQDTGGKASFRGGKNEDGHVQWGRDMMELVRVVSRCLEAVPV